jgi:LysM repeat protein
VADVLRPALQKLAEETSRFESLARGLRGAAVAAPLPGSFGPRYQAFVAAQALKQVESAAGALSRQVAVASRLESPSIPGPTVAEAARALASLETQVADATEALRRAAVPGSGAQAALRGLSGLEQGLGSLASALAVAGGRMVLVGQQAQAKPGPSAPPADHLAAGLTLEDLARVGAALGTPEALPALAWTAPVVAAVVDAGRRLGLLGPGGIDSRPLAAWALGLTSAPPAGQPGRPLRDIALLSLLRHAGIALERIDPSQVRQAAGLVSEARTLQDQLEALARVLDAFQVLARVGLPALPREVQDRMKATATATAAIATAEEAATVELPRSSGTVATPATASADRGFSIGKAIGGVFKAIGGLFKGIGGALKSFFNAFLQILPFLLTILSFIPVTAPFAMVANAALAVYTAVKTKNPLALVGAVASFVGAGAVFAASRVVGAAATTLQRVADVANSVARVAKGIAAAREGDLVGGLSAIAGGAASGAGALAGGAANGLSAVARGLQEVAGKVGTAYQVYQAARRGDVLGAVGLGAGLAGDLGATSPEARGVLAQVSSGAFRLRAAQSALRSGNYADAASVVSSLAADLSEGSARALLGQAGETLGRVATAQRLIQGQDYLGAAAELTEAAVAYGGSASTRQTLLGTAALFRRIGGAVADGLRGDYVAAAGSLAGVVEPGVLGSGARLDERTLAQLQKAAAVFQRAAGIWPALGGGDFRAAEALARELQALFADDPGNQVRFGQVVGFLHEAATIQDLMRRGEYPGAAARLGSLAPSFLPTENASGVFERIASVVAEQEALRRALKAGDYAQATEVAARMLERIRRESSRQTLQLGASALGDLAAVSRALDGGDTPAASRLGGDLARWLERNHAAAAAAYPSVKGLDSERAEPLRAAVSGLGREIGRANDEAVRQEAAGASADWAREALRLWTYVTRSGESVRSLARRFGVTPEGLLAANPEASDTAPLAAGLALVVPEEQTNPTYTVQPGDTLASISRRYNTTIAELLRLNPAITDPDHLAVGQVLVVPAARPPAPAPGPAPAPRPTTPRPTSPAPAPSVLERAAQGWDAFWDRLFGPAPTTPGPVTTAAGGELALGVNAACRDAILLASQRTGVDAAAIAALIDAEAGRYGGSRLQSVTDDTFYARHPELNRRPLEKTDEALIAEWVEIREALKRTWDPSAVNANSQATGLTQFLKGTWLDQARTSGTYLNQVAKEKGYVDAKNQVVAGMTENLLDLRKDATLSIVAAAEYGKANLAVLDAKGLVPATATDDEKAKLMYLAHHEGSAGAIAVLNETLTDARAKVLLADNVGEKAREALVKEHGSEAKAYIAWLNGYIDDHIQPDRFRKSAR